MTAFTISLAGFPIRIEALHGSTKHFCRDYLSDAAPALCVRVDQRDLDREREKSDRERTLEGLAPRSYADEYLETLAVYRKIAAALLEKDVLLFHGSVMAYAGKAYLFTAPSGTGKTTHCRLWLSQIPGTHVLNGDKPLLRIEEDRVLACGTPWQGKEHYGRNEILTLEAICILTRDSTNHIEALSFHDAFPTLIAQSNRPAEPQAMLKTLALTERLGKLTRLYRLGCNTEPEAALVSFHAMCGEVQP
ncbi:MAG: hypothetical protein IJQ36_02935 [Oscillospiraceae bacterium]|nr:hypothetical protein [Oscillospiraceae bacterium]